MRMFNLTSISWQAIFFPISSLLFSSSFLLSRTCSSHTLTAEGEQICDKCKQNKRRVIAEAFMLFSRIVQAFLLRIALYNEFFSNRASALRSNEGLIEHRNVRPESD